MKNRFLFAICFGLFCIGPVSSPKTQAAEEELSITILLDNRGSDSRLKQKWGFACLIVGLDKTILFDTGPDGEMLLDNMKALEIDPASVDCVVISHDHGDHTGGLAAFLQRNPDVTVYLPASCHGKHAAAGENKETRFVSVENETVICPNVVSTGELKGPTNEQSLVIRTGQGLVVVTGCAHPGVVRIAQKAKQMMNAEIEFILGGFHLGKHSEQDTDDVIQSLRTLGVRKAGPTHCTGDRQVEQFRKGYKDGFVEVGVGSVLRMPK